MAYADVSDLETRWRTLTTDEQERAEALLDDASAMLDAYVTVDETDEQQMKLLKIVVCNMVIRAMAATQAETFGVSNASMTAGSYTQSWTYSNPSGDMYLTKMEKKLLGIGSGKYRAIQAHTWADDIND